jgi:hypothetical protein
MMMGGMWFAHELDGNPANTNEQRIVGWSVEREPGGRDHQDILTNYTMTIGDVCFVAIGQIVGRRYQAARYQPTAIVLINSPTHDAMLTKQVRGIWASTNPPQHLLNSLLIDYAYGNHYGRTSFGDGAAMRLLYYFPRQTTNLIVSRLQTINLGKGNQASDFIKAIAESKEPTIRAELRKIFECTDDVNILCASLVATDGHRQEARERMEHFLEQVPGTEDEYYGDGYKLLIAMGDYFGADAKPAFKRYLNGANAERVSIAAEALNRTQGKWSVELLGPYLTDTRKLKTWTYPSFPKEGERQRNVRVCDAAALTIARSFPKLSFDLKGDYKDLDERIVLIRQKITSGDFQ